MNNTCASTVLMSVKNFRVLENFVKYPSWALMCDVLKDASPWNF